MSKLLISVRITESFFTSEEIKQIKTDLLLYNNKSEFIRKIIKNYLKKNNYNSQKNYNSNLEYTENLKELKNLVKNNNKLLQKLIINDNNINKNLEIYTGKEQENKTEKVLNLLNEF